MKLSHIILREAILPQLEAKDRHQVLKELSQLLVKVDPSLQVDEVCHLLEEREKLGSTGIGWGVAIPHGKIPTATKMLGCFGRSIEGIDFQSQDGELAHLFFVLIAPENVSGLHLKVLSRLSRILKDKSVREQLMMAKDADEIFEIISREDEKI